MQLCYSKVDCMQFFCPFSVAANLRIDSRIGCDYKESPIGAIIAQQSCNCCAIISRGCNYLKGLQLLHNSRATVVQLSRGFAIISEVCNYWNQWKSQWNPPIYTCLQSCTTIAQQLCNCRAIVAPQSLWGEIIARQLHNCCAIVVQLSHASSRMTVFDVTTACNL